MGLNNQWMQRDLAVLWHPCTQMKDHQQLPLIPIKRGEGVWLEDFEGKRYLDAVSSWWVNVFGHANPRINQRIKDQVDQLEASGVAATFLNSSLDTAEARKRFARPRECMPQQKPRRFCGAWASPSSIRAWKPCAR